MNWAENAVRQPVAALPVEAFFRATETEDTGLQALVSQWSPGDTQGAASTFSLRYHDPGRTAATPPGPSFLVNTDRGPFEVRGPAPLAPGWHHLAGIYDGARVSLLVDGLAIARCRATGLVQPCAAAVTLDQLEPGLGRFQGELNRARIFHAVVAETEMYMISYDAHLDRPQGLELRLELDTYFVLDQRETLSGYVTLRADQAAATRLEAAADPVLALTVRARGEPAVIWSTILPLGVLASPSDYPFALPMKDLAGGYYELALRVLGDEGPLDELTTERPDRRRVTFAKLGMGAAPAVVTSRRPARYLDFVKETMALLVRHQSARLGGDPQGALFLTGNGRHHLGYSTLSRRPDGQLHTGKAPASPFEMAPTRCDIELWPLLDELSRLSGDGAYAEMVDGMADGIARFGFHPRSGLIYCSEGSDFDVMERGPRGLGDHAVPRYKPVNTGNCPELPGERLWRHAPEQMVRCARSMFWGLVTDPDRMDFNRFTFFDYDDADQTPAMTATPSNLGFETAAARMIHWWSAAYGRTGDADCLDWARRMTAKWQAVQHPDSGLVPNFFGDGDWNPGVAQEPGAWAEIRHLVQAASAWMDAADELRRRPGAEDLAALLTEMAGKMALGAARHSYDPARQIFLEHLNLDGSHHRASVRYAFHTQAEKDAAVRTNPLMKDVPVYLGDGWYQPATFLQTCAGSMVPWHLAQVAERNGDAELIDRLARMSEDAVRAASGLDAPFTGEARWTFQATGLYVKLLVALHRMTGQGDYLDQARSLADGELDRLPVAVCPEWWRLRERAVLLDGLLQLYEAVV